MKLFFPVAIALAVAVCAENIDDFDDFDGLASRKAAPPAAAEGRPATKKAKSKRSAQPKKVVSSEENSVGTVEKVADVTPPLPPPEGRFRSIVVLTRADGSRYYFPILEVFFITAVCLYVLNYFVGSSRNKDVAAAIGGPLADELTKSFAIAGVGDVTKAKDGLATPLMSQSSPASFMLFASGGPQNIKSAFVELSLQSRQCLVSSIGGVLAASPLGDTWFGTAAETPFGILSDQFADKMIIQLPLEKVPPLTGAILKRGAVEGEARSAWPDLKPGSLITGWVPAKSVRAAVRSASVPEATAEAAATALESFNTFVDGCVDGRGAGEVLGERYFFVPEMVEAIAKYGSFLLTAMVTDRGVVLPATVVDPKITSTTGFKFEPVVRVVVKLPADAKNAVEIAKTWLRASLAVAQAAGSYRPATGVVSAAVARREATDKPKP